jgi:hypothetical protein
MATDILERVLIKQENDLKICKQGKIHELCMKSDGAKNIRKRSSEKQQI